jgi:hypothetical protein
LLHQIRENEIRGHEEENKMLPILSVTNNSPYYRHVEEEESKRCPICYLNWNITDRRPVEMRCRCKRVICVTCFEKSYEYNKKCPYCRYSF